MSRPLVIAHRGASAELPENTPAAFERAIELGADFVELDVHALPGGELAVCHDPPRAGEAPPRLTEALEVCRGRIGVMAELKTPFRYRRHRPVERTLALLGSDDVVICSEAAALSRARALRPGLRRIQLAAPGGIRSAAERGCWAVGVEDGRLGAGALRTAGRCGLETTVYTVNDPDRMLELAELGVGGIFTDDPRTALERLRPRAPTGLTAPRRRAPLR